MTPENMKAPTADEMSSLMRELAARLELDVARIEVDAIATQGEMSNDEEVRSSRMSRRAMRARELVDYFEEMPPDCTVGD